jgi:transcriptional regulator with XRE-family HTH domain
MGMTALARWLKRELELRGLTQQAAAVHAGVSVATVSDMLRKGHIPRMETLFRLADYLETPREEVLRLAAQIPLSEEEAAGREPLVQELVEEFRKLPDEWQEVVLDQVATYARLVSLPRSRIVGEEEEKEGKPEEKGESRAA